jgi:hypothetical protein
MSAAPLIVYIPGLKPKPEAGLHREQLLRCLLRGLRRIDDEVASAIDERNAFELVSWTYDFYGEYRDISQDLADIDLLLGKTAASEEDIAVATSLRRRFVTWLFQMADYLPFVLPKLATEEIEVHLRDFFRYVKDDDGIAETARCKLKSVLIRAHEQGRPVLLLAHSMGSVIAFESLWQLSRIEGSEAGADLFLTTGSPLGQKVVQRHLLGATRPPAERYPANIGQWINIAALGELTAIDRKLRNDFSAMISRKLVPDIIDLDAFNYYHMHGSLNVHAEYGYLVNEVTALCVSKWWREKVAGQMVS